MISEVTLSVVVPVYQHWDMVGALVRALEAQTIDKARFELILVANDDGPDAPITSSSIDIKMMSCVTPGSYAARNVGWNAARGAYVVFTDADCRPKPDWLAQFSDHLPDDDARLLAGDVEVVATTPRTLFGDYDALLGFPQEQYVQRGYAVTANLLVPRRILTQIAGFDEKRFSGGDAEFCRAAARAGLSLVFVPSAIVTHPARPMFRDHFKKLQRVRAGQIVSGPFHRRLKYLVRTSLPPLRRSMNILGRPIPLAKRFRALVALYTLWCAGFVETVRLLLGGKPVR